MKLCGGMESQFDMEIFSYAAECVKQIKDRGYYAIVVTNQSGVARGLFSEADLKKMYLFLQQQTGVDAIYYCPHHPEGKVKQYRTLCNCRKPNTGMFEQACSEYLIKKRV